MVRLKPDQPRPSTTTRRRDLPDHRRPARRGADSCAAVLQAVRDHGPVARSNLARLTGISTASVSGVTGTLVDRGLLREAPETAGPPGFGRPHVPLDVDAGANLVLGVHLAIPRATVAVVDLRGRTLASRSLPYDRPEPAAAVDAVAREVRLLREQYAGRRIHGIGAAIGGWVDEESGLVVENAGLGWRDVRLADLLHEATGLPTYVGNHGRALLRAEQLFGRHAQRARESIVHLFVGHVVDVAFSMRGQVHRGRGSASGSLAHLPVDGPAGARCACGRATCFQAVASDRTLLDRAARLGVRARYVTDLAELAGSGDQRIVRLFVERNRVVAQAVAHLLDLLGPEVLTLTEAGFLWVPEARAALHEEVAARSHTVDDTTGLVVPPSARDFLPVGGAAVLLDEIYAAPLELTEDLDSRT